MATSNRLEIDPHEHNWQADKENLTPLTSQTSRRSKPHALLSLIVSACCLLVKRTDNPAAVRRILINRLADGDLRYFREHLQPFLTPLCLWELSGGHFDRQAHQKEFDDAAAAWGYGSFAAFSE